MNDEIKEILEQLEWYRKIGKKDVYYPECVLPNKKAFILLDYITNLQQENEYLKKQDDDKTKIGIADHKYASQMEDKVIILQQENERLKEQSKKDNHILGCNFASKDKYKQRYEDYKSRCEKASEKLGNYKHYSVPTEEQNSENEDIVDSALNILQNGSDSQ